MEVSARPMKNADQIKYCKEHCESSWTTVQHSEREKIFLSGADALFAKAPGRNTSTCCQSTGQQRICICGRDSGPREGEENGWTSARSLVYLNLPSLHCCIEVTGSTHATLQCQSRLKAGLIWNVLCRSPIRTVGIDSLELIGFGLLDT